MHTRERKTVIVPRLMAMPELMAYLSMGRHGATQFAKEAGAERTVGKSKLYDREVIDEACDRLKAETEG